MPSLQFMLLLLLLFGLAVNKFSSFKTTWLESDVTCCDECIPIQSGQPIAIDSPNLGVREAGFLVSGFRAAALSYCAMCQQRQVHDAEENHSREPAKLTFGRTIERWSRSTGFESSTPIDKRRPKPDTQSLINHQLRSQRMCLSNAAPR